MRKQKLIYFLVCLFMSIFLQYGVVCADVGNSFSGGGGSSSSSSGSSSSGSGSSNYSYVYTPSYNSGSHGGSDNAVWISILTIGGLCLWGYAANAGGRSSGDRSSSNAAAVRITSPVQNQITEAQIVEKIRRNDPNFSETQFKAQAKTVWLSLQEAWEAKNWKSVRHLESEALFQLHNAQLQEYIDLGKTNHMDMQNIRSIVLKDYKEDGTLEILTVCLTASLLDYITDDKTGRVLEGSRQDYVYRIYRLEFIRPKGTLTANVTETKSNYCPNCGAPVDPASGNTCQYCQSVLNTSTNDWVINVYAPW